jgi:hypothetical protein
MGGYGVASSASNRTTAVLSRSIGDIDRVLHYLLQSTLNYICFPDISLKLPAAQKKGKYDLHGLRTKYAYG